MGLARLRLQPLPPHGAQEAMINSLTQKAKGQGSYYAHSLMHLGMSNTAETVAGVLLAKLLETEPQITLSFGCLGPAEFTQEFSVQWLVGDSPQGLPAQLTSGCFPGQNCPRTHSSLQRAPGYHNGPRHLAGLPGPTPICFLLVVLQ